MAAKPNVYVLGCGGHAKVVVQTLRTLGHDIAAVFDDDGRKWGRTLMGIPIQGPIEQVVDFPRLPAVIAVGDNAVRQAVAARLPLEWLTVVHPRAFVDPSAVLGPGTVVFAGGIVQVESQIGSHAIINTAASVDHDCRIGNWVHLAPGVRLAGGVHIEDGAFLGIGSMVLPERHVGARTIVGAGAVVIRDLPADATAVGVPARCLQQEV